MIIDFNAPDIYDTLLDVSGKFALTPSSSIEMEDWFRSLLATYPDSEDVKSFPQWLEAMLARAFLVLDAFPKWIQDPQWALDSAGQPMIFVGQIDIDRQNSLTASSIFHDDVVFYLFVSRNGERVVVRQSY